MGQLAVSVAGAVIGSFIPGVGTAIGWTAGSMLGSALFPPDAQKVQGPRLNDLKITGVEYGQAIPYIQGHPRLPGQIWWASDKREISTTTTSGGKGGEPETESTTFTYEFDALYGLTDNEIGGVSRIWWNGKLVWTNLASATAASRAASAATGLWQRMTVYTGAADQLPDPTYETAVGTANAVAYRNRGSIFFEGLQLGQGGQLPQLTFEVNTIAAATETLPSNLGTDVGLPVTLTNSDRTATWNPSGSSFGVAFLRNPTYGDTPVPWTGKKYMEFVPQGTTGFDYFYGLMAHSNWNASTNAYSANPLAVPSYLIVKGGFGGVSTGYITNGTATVDATCDFITNQDVVGMAVDFDALTADLYVNNVLRHSFTLPDANFDPYLTMYNQFSNLVTTVHLLASEFVYTPPSGFSSFPNTSILGTITPADEDLDDVVSRLCLRAGLLASQFDVTDLATASKDVRAMAISQICTTRSVIEMLAATYFFDATVSDKIYFRLRGSSSQATVVYTDLAASFGDSTEVEPLSFKRSNELEVPAQIALTYFNVDDDYQLDTQLSDRLLTAMESISSNQVPLGFTAPEAKATVDTLIMDAARGVITTSISLLGTHCRLEPTDVITVTGDDGSTFRIRLVKKVDNFPVLGFEAVLDHASVITAAGTTSTDYTGSSVVNAPADTSMVLMDTPIFRDADDDQGHYVAMRGTTPGVPWAGGTLLKSRDDIEYEKVAVVAESAILGVTTTALGDWVGPRVFDEMNSVVVDIGSGNVLSSSTRDTVLNSSTVNAMLVGSEIIQFITATMSESGVYTPTRLLRGCRGTEWAQTGHVAGESCVLLRTAGLRRVTMDNLELGVSRFYKGVTLGRALSSVSSATAFTNNAVGLKPFALFNIRGDRDLVTGDINFTWQRRSRLSVREIGALGINVPLGEESESYELDSYTNSAFTTVGRTFAVTSAGVAYTSSQLATDVRSVQDLMYVKVYQISDTVGRGYALQAII